MICVEHNNGWCIRKAQKLDYADHVPTLCRHVVTLPLGIAKRRAPTCEDCKKAWKRPRLVEERRPR
jgi:hypothetical protein